MKVGVIFPQLEIGTDPVVIRDYAQTIEGMGYDFLLAYEHTLGADPDAYPSQGFVYTYESMFHEPFVLFAYLAAVTQSLEFATGILILPQRNAPLVAKQAASLDVLAQGRLRLGIGVGWNRAEMENLGYDFSTRGKRVDEQLEVMRALWTKPLVNFEGEYHTLREVGINPLPVQRPIPLWFGGGAEPVLRRMVKYGAGWMVNTADPEAFKSSWDQLRGYLAEADRNPDSFGLDVRISVARQPVATWEKVIEQWREIGATHIGINTMGAGFTSIDEHINVIRAFKEMVE
ncbi:MAG: LLM class F420-dependent oxidoreductase [Anaerolineae bacterium]|nr:LLM class F420-dependent oxidoreductase [Anaerolineae bacterium]